MWCRPIFNDPVLNVVLRKGDEIGEVKVGPVPGRPIIGGGIFKDGAKDVARGITAICIGLNSAVQKSAEAFRGSAELIRCVLGHRSRSSGCC
jgi:hypothetical protein